MLWMNDLTLILFVKEGSLRVIRWFWQCDCMNVALINSDTNCDQQPHRVFPISEHGEHVCIIAQFFAWGYANCEKTHLLYVFPPVDKCTFAVRFSVNTACVIHKTTVCPVCQYFPATSTNNTKDGNPFCSLKQRKLYHVPWDVLTIFCLMFWWKQP